MSPAAPGAILHYSLPPVVGGVEAVIGEHTALFARYGYALTLVAGRGGTTGEAPPGVGVQIVPELNSQHPRVLALQSELAQGRVPPDFSDFTDLIAARLRPILAPLPWTIVHNAFTKHFNLALTVALFRLLDEGSLRGCVAWCHDISWTSAHARASLLPGYPWDLLRTPRGDVTYVTVSEQRRRELAGLFAWPEERLRVIYNGVDPSALLGLSPEGLALIERLDLLAGDPILLMPVRITQAKNIEYALRVVAALKARGAAPRLVVTGPPDPHDVEGQAYARSLLDLRAGLGLEREAGFVYRSGLAAGQPYRIDARVVGELFRLADLVFLPSHREGFGMPVLEAGLAGVPIFSASIPAAVEIGGSAVHLIDPGEAPEALAGRLLDWAAHDPQHRLRAAVRRRYTWEAIFRAEIAPLVNGLG